MFFRVVTNRATPMKVRLLALLAVAYVVSPIDLVPDFVPILGWLDDVGMVALLVKLAYRFLPKELYDTLHAKVYGGVVTSAPENAAQPKREPVTIDVTPER